MTKARAALTSSVVCKGCDTGPNFLFLNNHDGTFKDVSLISGPAVSEDAGAGTSYMSASDPRIHFDLGKRGKIESLVITWPSGQVDKLANLPIDQVIAVKEGAGSVSHPFPRVPADESL